MTKSQKRRLQRKQSKSKQKSKIVHSDSIHGCTHSTICWAKQVNKRVRLEVFSRAKAYTWWSDSVSGSMFRNILKDLKTLKALAIKHKIGYKEVTITDVGDPFIRCSAHPLRGIGIGCDHCQVMFDSLEKEFLSDYLEFAYSKETYDFLTSNYLFSLTRNW